jgi:hypothetical protein
MSKKRSGFYVVSQNRPETTFFLVNYTPDIYKSIAGLTKAEAKPTLSQFFRVNEEVL